MVATRTNCDAQQLQKLLSDELSELDEARATDHVGRCSTCRTRLEQLAAGGDWWRQAGEHLRGSRWNQDGTLWLTSGDFFERAVEPPDSTITSLDFLESSDPNRHQVRRLNHRFKRVLRPRSVSATGVSPPSRRWLSCGYEKRMPRQSARC